MFSSSIGRHSLKSKSSIKPKTNKHPYGDDWEQNSALCRKRDDYRCMAHKIGLPKCDNRFPPPLHHLIHAHHIVPWIKSKNNSLKNLISLCTSCHSKTHGKQIGYSATDAQIKYSKKLR